MKLIPYALAGIIGAFGAAYQFVTGHQVFAPPEPKISIPEAYVELFGPPKALSDDNPPELQISVKTGTKGEWCGK